MQTASVAAEFGVTQDAAHATLSDLCDRNLIEKLYQGKYAIIKWQERDASEKNEQLLC
jgi:hypothetical protein